MWSVEHTERTTATSEAVWAIWEDVDGWPRWDGAVAGCRLDGPFAVGTRGTLSLQHGRDVPFLMTEVRRLDGFADVTRLPLARLRFVHELTDDGEDGLLVTHRVEITGPLGFVFARVIGPDIERDLPASVHELVRLAQQPAARLAA